MFYNGLKGKTKRDFIDGNKKYITYKNIFLNTEVNIKMVEFVKIESQEKQNLVQYGDVLFTGSSETNEDCAMSSVVTEKILEPVYLNSFCFGYRLYDNNLLLPRFMKHYFRSKHFRKEVSKTVNGVTRFNVSKQRFSKTLIPIPTMEDQKKIINILDRFDTLINDISTGLPAEQKARRKQYEYYREKLLTFSL